METVLTHLQTRFMPVFSLLIDLGCCRTDQRMGKSKNCVAQQNCASKTTRSKTPSVRGHEMSRDGAGETRKHPVHIFGTRSEKQNERMNAKVVTNRGSPVSCFLLLVDVGATVRLSVVVAIPIQP